MGVLGRERVRPRFHTVIVARPSQPREGSHRRDPVVRKNRSAGVSPASEPRQLLLGQHDLCRLEAGDTFFLTTAESAEKKMKNDQ